jgi:hypothetical protein
MGLAGEDVANIPSQTMFAAIRRRYSRSELHPRRCYIRTELQKIFTSSADGTLASKTDANFSKSLDNLTAAEC